MKRKISLDEIYLELNVKKYLGKNYTEKDAIFFGEKIIQKILERTSYGIDRNNKAFPKYSESYKNSLAFKAYGKTDAVNLELTGAMLSSLDILEFDGERLLIGIKQESEIPKAYNHITGDTLPKRDFLGIPKDEIELIAEEIKLEIESNELKQEMRMSVLSDEQRSILGKILEELEIEEELLWQELL